MLIHRTWNHAPLRSKYRPWMGCFVHHRRPMMTKLSKNRPINVTHTLKVTVPRTERKVALVMGVYNWRSIAWYAVKNLLASGYDCIMTFEEQNEDEIQALGSEHMLDIQKQNDGIPEDEAEFLDRAVENELNMPLRYVKQQDTKLAGLVCHVEEDLPHLFQEKIPEMLQEFGAKQLDCIIHSVAHIDLGRNRKDKPLLRTTAVSYHQAQHVTTYSFLETARQAVLETNLLKRGGSMTSISYIGAVRGVPGYHVMGPVQASLESMVRGLALELRPHQIRVNAVSAGPCRTHSYMSIPVFRRMRRTMNKQTPLHRSCTRNEVAETVQWLATKAQGMTGKIMYVDAGYNTTVSVCYPRDWADTAFP